MREPTDPHNRYAAPTTLAVVPLRAQGLFLKWIHLACLVASAGVRFGSRDHAAGVELALGIVAVSDVVGFAWLAVAWTNFPPEDLHFTKLGRYTAFSAMVRLLIPCYGLYWGIVNLSLLCNAINDSLQRREMPMRVPFALAIAGPALLLVGQVVTRDIDARLLLLWASGALWFLFMLQCDHARRFMILACNAGRERVAAARATMSAGGDANAV